MATLTHPRRTGRAVALGLVIAAVCAGSGQASTGDDALRALQIRSEGLNLLYGLGGTAKAGADAINALAIRSEAMNELYGLGSAAPGSGADAIRALTIRSEAMNELYGLGSAARGSGADAIRALTVRSEAMNERYGLGPTAGSPVAGSGFDWADAAIGIAMGFVFALLAGFAMLLVRRQRRPAHTQL